jgi:cAMP-dependent protein kinase regulator
VTAGICDIYVAGLDPLTDPSEEGPATSELYGGRVQITCAGDSFGELALMYNAPRAATVVARTDVGLWAVDRTTFRTLVMGVAIAKRSKHSTYLEGVQLLSTLTQAERETVIDNMEEESYAEGDVVIEQGEMGSKFFIVTEGDLVVTQTPEGSDEPREVGRLKEGSYFGEIALLTHQQRLATVKAVSQVQCVTIERKVFSRVMGPLRDLLQRNMSLYNSYISISN